MSIATQVRIIELERKVAHLEWQVAQLMELTRKTPPQTTPTEKGHAKANRR